jgi:hypothetical protein
MATERKFKVGDKVVPISKTYKEYQGLRNSSNWNKAKDGQGFLYVLDPIKAFAEYLLGQKGNPYILSTRKDSHSGDFFMESDLIPYKTKTNNKMTKAKLTPREERFLKVINENSPVVGTKLSELQIIRLRLGDPKAKGDGGLTNQMLKRLADKSFINRSYGLNPLTNRQCYLFSITQLGKAMLSSAPKVDEKPKTVEVDEAFIMDAYKAADTTMKAKIEKKFPKLFEKTPFRFGGSHTITTSTGMENKDGGPLGIAHGYAPSGKELQCLFVSSAYKMEVTERNGLQILTFTKK